MTAPTCKGAWILGSACGRCGRCLTTAPEEIARLREKIEVEARDARLCQKKHALAERRDAFHSVATLLHTCGVNHWSEGHDDVAIALRDSVREIIRLRDEAEEELARLSTPSDVIAERLHDTQEI